MEPGGLFEINPKGRIEDQFTDGERARAAAIACAPSLTYFERIRELAMKLNLTGGSAADLLDQVYLTRKSGQELIEEGYTGRRINPNLRKYLDQVRSLPPEQFYDLFTPADVSWQLKIPGKIAAELLYAQRKIY